MMAAREWLAKRRELLSVFDAEFRDEKHDYVGLAILARTDLPRALNALEEVRALHENEEIEMPNGQTGWFACKRCSYAGIGPCPTAQAIEKNVGI